MKCLLFSMVICAALTGFAHEGDHAEEAKVHEGSHGKGHEAKLSVGVKQPDIIREKAILPGKVELLEPAPLAKVSGGSVTLKWKPSSGASVHHVQVATDPRFKWMVIENAEVTGDSFPVSNLQQGQQYFWRVAGRAPDHDASWTKGYFTSSSFEVK